MIWPCLACESRVEGGGLHFHRQDALCATLHNHRFRLPKRRIGRPTRSNMQGNSRVVPVCADHLSQGIIQAAVRRGRYIMVARPLVAQGFVNEDHVGRLNGDDAWFRIFVSTSSKMSHQLLFKETKPRDLHYMVGVFTTRLRSRVSRITP
jgi:hypothetical protein